MPVPKYYAWLFIRPWGVHRIFLCTRVYNWHIFTRRLIDWPDEIWTVSMQYLDLHHTVYHGLWCNTAVTSWCHAIHMNAHVILDYVWQGGPIVINDMSDQWYVSKLMCKAFNSLSPETSGSNFKKFNDLRMHDTKWSSWALLKLLWSECHRTSPMISQHWFR